MNCDVYIDDVKVGELAAQNAGAMHKQKLFEKKDLANTKHTLRVVPKEGESIEGKVIQLDKIVVFHDEITVPDSIVLIRAYGVCHSVECKCEACVDKQRQQCCRSKRWKTDCKRDRCEKDSYCHSGKR